MSKWSRCAVWLLLARLSRQREDLQRGHAISVDMAEMNRIIQLHDRDFQVVVQPGVSLEELNLYLNEHGTNLFLPAECVAHRRSVTDAAVRDPEQRSAE